MTNSSILNLKIFNICLFCAFFLLTGAFATSAFGQEKTHGLIVDYIGIFDDVARALDFDEKAVQQVVSNIDDLRKELPIQVQKCLGFFPGVDRSVGGYEGLMANKRAVLPGFGIKVVPLMLRLFPRGFVLAAVSGFQLRKR